MRICVVRLGGMGDILLATPTLRALAAHYQTDQVDFVVGPGMEAAVTGLPYAARILAFDRKKHWGAGLPGFVKTLKSEGRYELFLNFQPSVKTLTLSALAQPNQTIVFKKDRRKQPDTGRVRHAIDDFAKELVPLGITVTDRQLDFFVPESARLSLAAKLDISTRRPMASRRSISSAKRLGGQRLISRVPAGLIAIKGVPMSSLAASESRADSGTKKSS